MKLKSDEIKVSQWLTLISTFYYFRNSLLLLLQINVFWLSLAYRLTRCLTSGP